MLLLIFVVVVFVVVVVVVVVVFFFVAPSHSLKFALNFAGDPREDMMAMISSSSQHLMAAAAAAAAESQMHNSMNNLSPNQPPHSSGYPFNWPHGALPNGEASGKTQVIIG